MARPTASLPFDFSAKFVQPLAAGPGPASEAKEGSGGPPPGAGGQDKPRALTVGELGRAVKQSLDASFDRAVWVEGEVTGARPAGSGHMYFTFKDEREDASIDVAVYKTNLTPRMRAMVVDGARIRLRGRPTFWAPRGRLQFVADRVEAAGKGALLEALEKLKTKLAAEGIFAPERKRPIPTEPRVIGVVTSRTGAVIHDICTVAFRRGGARILLAPATVQGAGAASAITRALRMLARVNAVEVIIVGRGGGSSDDLSAFNEEEVVRAVVSCRVPVISAVGHEVDVTLTDFAADARAATPSQAAEMVVPDARARRHVLGHTHVRLLRAMRAGLAEGGSELTSLRGRLGDPRLLLASFQQTTDDRLARLEEAAIRPIARGRERLAALERRLSRLHPSVRLEREAGLVKGLEARMAVRIRRVIAQRREVSRELAAGLDAMSPLRVLGRGYAIATTEGGRAVRDAGDVQPGDLLDLRVARARVVTQVVSVVPERES